MTPRCGPSPNIYFLGNFNLSYFSEAVPFLTDNFES
jgi:hypothetical protein